VEAQARHDPQVNARCQFTAQEAGSTLQSIQDFGTSGRTFNRRDVNIGKSQFPVHLDIGDKNLLQARVTYFAQQKFREFLLETVSNTF
jgi:hypothetical protein